MDDQSINNKLMSNADIQGIEESNLQKPNIYNQYSPFHQSIQHQANLLFEEIRENLSRTIQQEELQPGFSYWSIRLQRFLSLYGYNFTKVDHLKVIHFYLSILSIPDLNSNHAEVCFDTLYDLLRYIFYFLASPIQKSQRMFLEKLV